MDGTSRWLFWSDTLKVKILFYDVPWSDIMEHCFAGRCPCAATSNICYSREPSSRASAVLPGQWRDNPKARVLQSLAPYVEYVVTAKETGKETFFNDAVQNASEALVDILYKNKGEVLKPQYELEI